MDNQSLVSIIIPTYNRANFISETLDSVIAQTYQNWECIVVDDGSTDNTEEILQSYINKDNRISYHQRPDNYKPGGNGARNYGFDISKGEYINWFDSDDVMLPNLLEAKINFQNYNLVIASHKVVDFELQLIEDKIINVNFETLMYEYITWKNELQFVTNNILFKKRFLVGHDIKFNENILRGQESELLVRVFRLINKDDLKVISDITFLYRQHENTKTYLSTIYNEKFRKDNIYYFLDILKHSKEGGDEKLCNYSYQRLVNFLIESKFKSKNNYNYIMNGLLKILGLRFIPSFLIMIFYKNLWRDSKKIQNYLRSFDLKLK